MHDVALFLIVFATVYLSGMFFWGLFFWCAARSSHRLEKDRSDWRARRK
jgi:hypothetical protein